MSSPPSTATLTTVHPDITSTHILTRLDGPALAALTCASTHLSSLTTDDNLWKSLTAATWPSTADIRVRTAVSSFPSGHRSLFSDAFPLLHAPTTTAPAATSSAHQLISAVDLYYENDPIFSTVHVTDFLCRSQQSRPNSPGLFWAGPASPFRIELIDRKEPVPTRIENTPAGEWRSRLEKHLTLSWIIIDPVRNKAANFSSREPVSVTSVNGEVQVRFSTVVGRSTAADIVQIGAVVDLSGGGGRVHVREMSMHVEDVEERRLSGEESLSIVLAAMDGGKRKKWEKGEGKVMFEKYEEMRRERKRKIDWRKKALCYRV